MQAARIAPGASKVGDGLPSFALVDARDFRAALDATSGVAITYSINADALLCWAASVGLYRQHFHDAVELERTALSDVHRWHTAAVDAVRPSTVNIDTDLQHPACGDPLLEGMPRACLQRGVRRIVVSAGLDTSNGYPGDAVIAS